MPRKQPATSDEILTPAEHAFLNVARALLAAHGVQHGTGRAPVLLAHVIERLQVKQRGA